MLCTVHRASENELNFEMMRIRKNTAGLNWVASVSPCKSLRCVVLRLEAQLFAVLHELIVEPIGEQAMAQRIWMVVP